MLTIETHYLAPSTDYKDILNMHVDKKLCYLTRAVSVEILSTNAQLYRNKSYNNSTTNRSVCTTQRHVIWLTSVCRQRLLTVVASLALLSPGPSWCPGLGRLLASVAMLRMAPGPGTDYQLPFDHHNLTVAFFIQAAAQDPLVCSSTRQCLLQLWVSCTIVRRFCTASSAPTTNV